MSNKSKLRELFGPRVEIRDIDRVPSGSPHDRPRSSRCRSSNGSVAEALAKRGLTLLQAKRIVTRLAKGESVAAEIPTVEDVGVFEKELKRHGVIAERRDPPEDVNVKEIRERLGLSQDEFAMRFGFDAASLRNWEQKRTVPETAVRSFFKVIEVTSGSRRKRARLAAKKL